MGELKAAVKVSLRDVPDRSTGGSGIPSDAIVAKSDRLGINN